MLVQLPFVVEEPRARGKVGSSRQRGNGIPLDLAGVWIHAEEDILSEIDEVSREYVDRCQAGSCSRCATDGTPRSLRRDGGCWSPGAEEIGRLSLPLLVVPLLRRARSAAAGGRGRASVGAGVEQQVTSRRRGG